MRKFAITIEQGYEMMVWGDTAVSCGSHLCILDEQGNTLIRFGKFISCIEVEAYKEVLAKHGDPNAAPKAE